VRPVPPGFDAGVWEQLERGRAQASSGDVAGAGELYRDAYEACRARQDHYYASVIAHQAGVAEPEVAKKHEWNLIAVAEADAVADRTRVRDFYASNLNNLGMTYARLGERARAKETFDRALRHAAELAPGAYADQVRGGIERNLARLSTEDSGTEAETSVRRATDDDVPALTRLINAAYRALGEMGLNFTGVTQDEATTRMRMNGCEVFVIERRDTLIGSVKIRIRDDDGLRYAEMTQLAVDPAQQLGGLGTRLVGLVEKRAMELGVDRVRLDTAIPARDLVRWYERRGYAAMGEIQREGKNYRSVILEKVLS